MLSVFLDLVTPRHDVTHSQLCFERCLPSSQGADLGSRKIQRKGVNSLEDFKDPTVSYSFEIAKNDHDPNFCDHETVIILWRLTWNNEVQWKLFSVHTGFVFELLGHSTRLTYFFNHSGYPSLCYYFDRLHKWKCKSWTECSRGKFIFQVIPLQWTPKQLIPLPCKWHFLQFNSFAVPVFFTSDFLYWSSFNYFIRSPLFDLPCVKSFPFFSDGSIILLY